MNSSLQRRHHELSVISHQVDLLEHSNGHARFDDMLDQTGVGRLTRLAMRVMQINVGRMCNQVCTHCHVDAGPDRKEIMTRATMTQCLKALERADFEVVDITGGAPEMNPDFRWLVERISGMGRHVIDRCNLTILTLPAYRDMVDFLAGHRVEIVASLPGYT
ncbi:MAG: radical SAM protein, partial [Planctomycetes bacterium]|nr:radical SAM protein [Planctomycetota bacterium]